MRVLFYGNCGNMNLRMASWMREFGVDCTLYIPGKTLNARSDPQWLSHEFSNHYPDWIKVVERKYINAIVPEKEVRVAQKDYDIIFTTGLHIISALALKKPVVFLPVGSDLSKAPFGLMDMDRIHFEVYKKRLNKLEHVITHVENVNESAKKLHVKNIYNIGFPVDIAGMEENIDTDYFNFIRKKYSQYQFVFLLAARKIISPDHHTYKGVERFVYAFSRMLRDFPSLHCKCISLAHGEENDKFEQVVDKLGLKSYFEYLPQLPLSKLHAFMSLDNMVVVDRFTHINRGCFGGIGREAMSLGAIVLTCTDPSLDWFRKIHDGNCPVLTAYTEDEIYMHLTRLLGMKGEDIARIKADARDWSRRNLDYKCLMDAYIDVLSGICMG